MTRRLLSSASLLALVGCSAGGSFPSLAPRAVEKQGFGEPVTPVAAAAADPELDRQLEQLGARLDAITAGFAKAAGEADRKAVAARGETAGSDPWIEAQTALGALDDWRAQASALATDVEQAAIERAAKLAPPYPALTALGDRTDAEDRRQGEVIARLQGMLAPA